MIKRFGGNVENQLFGYSASGVVSSGGRSKHELFTHAFTKSRFEIIKLTLNVICFLLNLKPVVSSRFGIINKSNRFNKEDIISKNHSVNSNFLGRKCEENKFPLNPYTLFHRISFMKVSYFFVFLIMSCKL